MTVLPLSSTRRKLYPGEVQIPSGAAGQPKDSIAMAHQIRTISKERVVTCYGHLEDPELQARVVDAILDHLDITVEEE